MASSWFYSLVLPCSLTVSTDNSFSYYCLVSAVSMGGWHYKPGVPTVLTCFPIHDIIANEICQIVRLPIGHQKFNAEV